MHVLITDSGVGGLSVCAYVEQAVRCNGRAEPLRLTFVNAAPEDDYGYNAMPSREVKLATFERFLARVVERYAPDSIYVACNTLSVLLPDTAFARSAATPVRGIVDEAVWETTRELGGRPQSVAIVFATPTTIEAGTYTRLLGPQIVAQACPGLADTISEGDDAITRATIGMWVDAAVARLPRRDVPVIACLACTHYGYRKPLFEEALHAAGVWPIVIDPNARAVRHFVGQQPAGPHCDVEIEIVSRYVIPDATLAALARFLGDISPRTVAALQRFHHEPELF